MPHTRKKEIGSNVVSISSYSENLFVQPLLVGRSHFYPPAALLIMFYPILHACPYFGGVLDSALDGDVTIAPNSNEIETQKVSEKLNFHSSQILFKNCQLMSRKEQKLSHITFNQRSEHAQISDLIKTKQAPSPTSSKGSL